MRGRKQSYACRVCVHVFYIIKKESPNEGTETRAFFLYIQFLQKLIKKESPNEGTETEMRAYGKLPIKSG